MAFALVPTIQISPPPPQEPFPEPYSPFNSLSFPEPDVDSFRPTLLTPPPTHTTFTKHLSPLCPSDAPVNGRGLERERFEALLRASKERNALVGAKRAVDLRKEIALKAHRNKQVERRALFLSKVLAPPSPTATSTPKTPPDSPAIFHYSLPSPGLVSPLALFDSLHDNNEHAPYTCHPWVEQVDFRLNAKKQTTRSANLPQTTKAAQILPSLDQISARLKTLASARSTTIVDGLRPPAVVPPPSAKPATIEIGRLKMPLRAPKLAPTSLSVPEPPRVQHQPRVVAPPPKSPDAPFPSDLQVTITLVPRTAAASSAQLTENNLKILNAREHRAHNMLSTLRRRTVSAPQQTQIHSQTASTTDIAVPKSLTKNAARRTMPLPLPEEIMGLGLDDRKCKWKRHSAPADLMPRERTGFSHPILSLPGAF